MPGVKRGIFITFEGVEGSGKTTQAHALVDWLSKNGIPHVFVRDPGTTRVGEAIRDILLDQENKEMNRKCEVLLFLAARSQLTDEKIMPSINQKMVVVSDRFADSTYAYQVFGRLLPGRLIGVFNKFATAGIKPDLTFLVDIDVAKGRERGKYSDRMEREGETYHKRVRSGYLRLAHRAKKRVKILDGEKPIEFLKGEVIRYVKALLVKKGYKL